MYPYIKVNAKVLAYLHLEGERYTLPTGEAYLWKFDLAPLGGNNDATIQAIGGLGLSRHDVLQEQRGEVCFTLPEASDERFRLDEVPSAEEGDLSLITAVDSSSSDGESLTEDVEVAEDIYEN